VVRDAGGGPARRDAAALAVLALVVVAVGVLG
jgi:hypothetical protein